MIENLIQFDPIFWIKDQHLVNEINSMSWDMRWEYTADRALSELWDVKFYQDGKFICLTPFLSGW